MDLKRQFAPADIVTGVTLCALALSIYLLRLNHAAGLMVDDAWYVLLAKSLADGNGYKLISAPTAILPLYPPGFPAILSTIFHVSGGFPGNVSWLKAISIAAMLGTGALTTIYLHRDRLLPLGLAACAGVAVAITPAFVFLATSTVMSECAFTFVQLSTVVLLHRSGTAGSQAGSRLAVGAALSGAVSVLIRSAGLGAVIAGGLWFLSQRQWKRAVIFAGVTGICLAPWMLYARAHKPTADEQSAHRGSIVFAYTDQFWMRWAGAPASGHIAVTDLPERIWINLTDVVGRDIGGIFVPSFLRGADESGEEVVSLGTAAGISAAGMGNASATLWISTLLGMVICLGFASAVRDRFTPAEWLVPISIAITLLWPFWSFRFVLPLAPFLTFYLILGIQVLARGSAMALKVEVSDLSRAPRLVMLTMIGLALFDHAHHILLVRELPSATSIRWLSDAAEVDRTLAWMDGHLDPDAVVASTNPALVYLRTGRKAVTLDTLTEHWATWRRRGVRYVACLLPAELPSNGLGDYKVLYRAGKLWVIEI